MTRNRDDELFRGPRDRAELRTAALLAGGLSLIVLVVVCANLGNLVLSHTIGRVREFSLRAALGATRWRIVRQHLVESALVTAAAAVVGLLFGRWLARIVAAQVSLPPYVDFSPDWRVVAATCVVALVATLAVGLVPAWVVSRRDLVAAIKDGGHQTTSGLARGRLRLSRSRRRSPAAASC